MPTRRAGRSSAGASWAPTGFAGGGHEHGDHPYTVVGVLAPCGCVLDRLVLTSLESVWQVHEHAQADDPDDLAELRKEREVTLALVRYRSPLAAVTLPRAINSGTPMQAAAPAVEITRLVRLLGVGADVLRAFGGVLLGVAALSVFMGLWSAVRERRADLGCCACWRAAPARGRLLLAEALWLALLASAAGSRWAMASPPSPDRCCARRAPCRSAAHCGCPRNGPCPPWHWPWLPGGSAARVARLPHRRGRPAGPALNLYHSFFFHPSQRKAFHEAFLSRLALAPCWPSQPCPACRPIAPTRKRPTPSATAPWPPRTKPPPVLEAGKGHDQCMKELQAACKGLAIGKFCGMKHQH